MERRRVILLGLSLPMIALRCATAFSQSMASAEGAHSAIARGATNAAQVTYAGDVLPIIVGRCFSCHNDQTRFLRNWSDYNTAFTHREEIKRRVWDSWKGEYFKEPMPAGNSPQCLMMTEEERLIIKKWVETGAVKGIARVQASARNKAERIAYGHKIFSTLCSACHQLTGLGIPDRFPPLAGSDFLNSDKARAIKTVLNGRQGEIIVNGRKFNNVMPKFPLTDDDIANVLTYVYNSFANCGNDVTCDEVKALRGQKPDPSPVSAPTPPSPFE